jgi:putative ABC transport system permease protein
MFKHLFKLIWNKKKQNFLLITEMFVSFLVLFAVFSMVVYFYQNYKKPRGFEYENVWVVSFSMPRHIQSNDSINLFAESMRKSIKSMPEVRELTFTSMNVPFAMSTNSTSVNSEQQQQVQTNIFETEPAYKDVLDLNMVEGSWFAKGANVSKLQPVILNQKLKETLFGNGPALGKTLGERNYQTGIFEDRFKVVGVVQNLKETGDYQAIENGLYRYMDSGGLRWNNTILLKVHPGADAAFESRLFKTLSNMTGTSIEIEHLEKKRISKNKLALVPMIIMLIVGGFLIINVAMGLFGVLWYNINKRRGEIGLRRAIGASGSAVSKQLIGEAMVLATLALLVGSFFAVQFPLLHVFDLPASVYVMSILLAIGFIYLLVFLCALYPGKQAAAIYPAVALHEE